MSSTQTALAKRHQNSDALETDELAWNFLTINVARKLIPRVHIHSGRVEQFKRRPTESLEQQ